MTIILLLLFRAAVTLAVATNVFGQKTTIAKKIGVILVDVQGMENARILVDNNLFLATFQKGRDKKYDSYPGFQDDGGQKTEMDAILRRNGIDKVVVYGIATDYCVRDSGIDAAHAGYAVIMIEELCRGVAPDTSDKALEEMKRSGVIILDKLDIDKIKGL